MDSGTSENQSSANWLVGGGEAGDLIRTIDWSKTSLGPIGNWPQSLRTSVSLCLSSTFPILICWGPDDIQIYNDSYRPICGDLHPGSMGMPFKVCWEAALPVVGDKFDRAHLGEGTYINNQRMFLERFGYLEEAWMTFSFGPIRDETGGVGGIFHPITETTNAMLSARRTQTLKDFSTRIAPAKSVEEILNLATLERESYELDLPFFAFYQRESDDRVTFLGQSGLDEAPVLRPQIISLGIDGWPFADIENELFELRDLESRFGSFKVGPYDESPKLAAIVPITPPGHEGPFGYFVAGTSPRRAFDDEYRNFIILLAGVFTTAISNVLAFENEQKRLQALAEIDRAKTAFFSNVSHEFRTPLTLILGPLEDSLSDTEDPLTEKQRARQVVTHRNAMRLLKLVNSLLDFSRTEAGRAQVSYQATDLRELTANLASGFRSAIERAGLNFELNLEELPEAVFVDRDMWEKIVLNLLSNAFKFTFEGSIGVTLRSSENAVTLEVKDSGIGISEANLPKLFERFHRVHGAKGRSFEGTGIGLALVQELVHLHGGTINAKSEVGVGTSFIVTIPTGRAHLPADKIAESSPLEINPSLNAYVEEAKQWITGPTSETKTDHLNKPTVIVADDNSDMLAYIVSLLDSSYRVIPVSDGQEAFDSAEKLRPSLILTDVMMPKLDGFGLLTAIRSHPDLKETPVILLSARAGEEARIEGLNAGADDYLIKPFAAKELVSKVATTLKNELARVAKSEALRESEARFRSMFAHASVSIVLVDLEGRILQANDAFSQSLGYRTDEVVGRHFSEFTHPDDVQDNLATVGKLLSGELVAATFEKRYLKRNGETLWVQISLSVSSDADGALMHIIAVSQDISNRKLAEERALSAKDEAIRANLSKTAFLANMSHEIRTPMTAVLGFTEILRDPDLTENVKIDAISRIEKSGRALLKLIDDILDISKVEAGKTEISKVLFSPEELTAEVVSLLRLSSDQKGVRLSFQAANNVPAQATSDPARLRQILINLIGNAVKFTDRGEVNVQLHADDGKTLRFVMTDTGLGISESDQKKLFQPFGQADESITRKYGGTGLGLILSQRLAKILGGDIVLASSVLGKGSQFVVTIEAAPFTDVVAEAPTTNPPSTTSLAATLQGCKILVAEDTPDNQVLMRRYLESAGAMVTMVGNGAEAVAAASAQEFDLILMDMQMPVLDGLSATKQLRTNGYKNSIMALTAHAMPEEIARSLAAGCDGHLSKPITKRELITAVLGALR